LVISVVNLVTRDEDENLSIFSKEYFCIFLKTSLLKFLANPAEAFAHVYPAIPPQQRDITAITTSNIPVLIIFSISTPSLI
jgi:hypothetical protein